MAKNGRKEVDQRKGEEKKEPQVRDEQQEALREKAIKNMARRPDYGKSGRHTHVLTNYFEIKKTANKSFLEKYEITMKLIIQQRPEGEGNQRRRAPRQQKQLPVNVQRAVFQQLERQERNGWFKGVGVVFDGNTTLYSTDLLKLNNSDSGNTLVSLSDDQDSRGNPMEYKVEVQKLDKVDLDELKKCLEGTEMKWEYFDLAGIRGLNALIHHIPSMKYTQFGESTYLPSTRKPLGGGVELWMGWFESVRPGQDSYFVNVNTTYTVFYEPGILSNLITKYLNFQSGSIPDRLNQQENDRVTELIRGLQFKPIHRPQIETRFKIKRLCPKNAYDVIIDMPESSEKINIYTYFQHRYNITLRYLHLVELEGRRNDKVPIELCNVIEGQRFPVAKLTSTQRGTMIKHTALSPQENVHRINEGIQNVLQFGKDFKLNSFGMVVEEQMAVIPARVLRAPQISYHSSSKAGGTVKPREGGWNLKDRKFVRSGDTLRYWVVVAFIDQRRLSVSKAKQFVKELVITSRQQGMDIEEGNPRVNYIRPHGDAQTYQRMIEQEYENALTHFQNVLQLMLFILPDDDEKRYRAIKYTTDTVLGVPSQCVQLEKVQKKSKQYCANVALKINLKLGGTNQSLEETEIPELSKGPVMLLGADVTHPTGGRAGPSSIPSICAVVGSLDRQGGRFISKLESQKTRQEKIENMGGMVKEILKDYRAKNNILPQRMIMYRDGVSESQFEMVLTHELEKIKEACKEIEKSYNPPITFVVVGKRHHTRFYPQQDRDADSKGNCVAGTVVDSRITHPYLFDFFLQSHTSLHGTSRPAHYHVLFDENKFTADRLQNLTHKLCYNYQRATRSVSIAPAAYYAHLAAKRARLHLEQKPRGEPEFVLKEVKESLAKEPSTRQRISDQLTPSGRPIVSTPKNQNDRYKGNKNQRRGGGGNKNNRDSRDKISPILPNLVEIIKPEKKGFRAIPIIPTVKEILAPQPELGDIPINRIEEPYESINEYLETHYKLLREDCIRPLREGIRVFKANPEEKNRDLRVYVKINLVGVTFAKIGVVHRISFRTKDFERVNWSTSKRLLPGTLVVFSKDNFETMKFATVVNRPLELLGKSFDLQIDVLFRLEDIDFELSEGYVMVESTSSYFEAYRHVLNILQELDPETLPFKDHIVERNIEIEIPEYLKARIPIYEFGKTEAFQNLENCYGTSRLNVRKEWDKWPTIEEMNTELHISQYEALKRMLTCRLALVQGPPGTGKTYVGLTAVRILLENLPGTIVVACQTNHALDQFLEGIQMYEENIIRLGSRSSSQKIIPRTLFNIRNEMKSSSTMIRNRDINRLFAKKDKIEHEMKDLCKELGKPCLRLDFIKERGYLSDEQISSLKQDDWYTSSSSGNDDSDRDYIQEWLEASISAAIHILEADFQGVDGGQLTSGEFVELRNEKCIQSDVYVSEDMIIEYSSAEDLWSIPQEVRVEIHRRWRRERLEEIFDRLKQLCEQYLKLCDQIKTERIREDLFILKQNRVVGMTTTAAAKYHDLLINLAPKIMIIEEAAETLEAHIVTALTPATEHLILIGDHQQLRPNTSVHELAEVFKLDVSLFERLTNFLPYCQLTEQRRMRPEIRELLTPIYKDVLTDHEIVCNYPNVPGFCNDLFFFDHQEEEVHEEETMSKKNKFEAQMCTKFTDYLVKGGTSAKNITILSMYSGQRKLINQLLRDESRNTPEMVDVRVCSVDGFQGEENDIILLSLVRSRDTRQSIGFLSVANRVCVALSRAKHGMYIFGNASQLKMQSELWRDVLRILEKTGLCGQTIDLYCQKHSNPNKEEWPHGVEITEVSWYADIPPEGGCMRECQEVMECGHICPNKCHIAPHNTCKEKCIRKFPSCGHSCTKRCDDPCGNCEKMIMFHPQCGHDKEVPCYVSQSPTMCRATVRVGFPDCKHFDRSPCYKAKEHKKCPFC
ncbi:19284_t:CDS:10 [Funneliformis geosporum]|uniref:19284_t:CDS:1 n=1 Tax=Funneliformis geosporum TaxID=1117311 RepID=A0A9W4SJH0_9GLOM|nr:19284_t:CDS:10 [Funneliformis geosporum]